MSEVLADAPALYWRLGESSGTVAADSSGNGRNGTYVAPLVYGAASPVADDAGIMIADVVWPYGGVTRAGEAWAQLPCSAAARWTIEFWVRIDRWSVGNYSGIFATGDGTAGSGWYVFVDESSADPGACTIAYKANGGQVTSGAGALTSVGVWYHCAAVNNGTDVRWYVNGLLTSTTAEPATYTPAVGTLYLGVENIPDMSGQHSYDEAAIYLKALSAARVAAHYAAAGLSASGLTTGTSSAMSAMKP